MIHREKLVQVLRVRAGWFAARMPKVGAQAKPSANFRMLYVSSLLIDLGLCLYFFVFSLFLVEHHFSEQQIGAVTATFAVGSVAGIFLAGATVRRLGLHAMMRLYIALAPPCLAMRTLFLGMPAQLSLALMSGAAMSIWSVCFSPTLARLTTHENRAFGFSLFVATGIGSGVLAGALGGLIPDWLRVHVAAGTHLDGLRVVLLLACAFVALAGLAIRKVRVDEVENRKPKGKLWSPFLLRFMVVAAVWNFSISFFTPFANVYLARQLGLPMKQIGTIFSISQLVQVAAVMAAPIVYRMVGLTRGIALTQMATAIALLGLSRASASWSAPWIYILLTAVQWMGGPGISTLLMNRTPEQNRAQASATHNVVNLTAQAVAAAIAGKLFEAYGYAGPLAVNASVAVMAAVLVIAFLDRSPADLRLEESSEARNRNAETAPADKVIAEKMVAADAP